MNYDVCIQLLKEKSKNFVSILTEEESKKFIQKNGKYLYFIIWSSTLNIYSWGTMSGKSNRIRKSSILNPKLTGKYDRRVDYLMLLKIYGFESIYLFETLQDPTITEQLLKDKHGTKYCYNGLKGNKRDEISTNILHLFKSTPHFLKSSELDKKYFEEFMEDVFFKKLKHPNNPKRTFHYGDSLEPKFLHTIGKPYLEYSIERILDVCFYN